MTKKDNIVKPLLIGLIFLLVAGLFVMRHRFDERISILENRVTELEGSQKTPSILIDCQGNNPVVTITILYESNNLLMFLNSVEDSLSVSFGDVSRPARLGEHYYFGDVVNTKLKLIRAGDYKLEGWSWPEPDNSLVYKPAEFVFKIEFTVPDCK